MGMGNGRDPQPKLPSLTDIHVDIDIKNYVLCFEQSTDCLVWLRFALEMDGDAKSWSGGK